MVTYCKGECRVYCGFRSDKEKLEATIKNLEREGWNLISSECFPQDTDSFPMQQESYKYILIKY